MRERLTHLSQPLSRLFVAAVRASFPTGLDYFTVSGALPATFAQPGF